MTSGNFRTIAISEIVIDRANRQRRELTGLQELADSIRSVGLINPPVIDANNVLIAGERRFTACRDILGWTSIPVQDAATLDPAELHLIELEENVKRVDLTWQDQCNAMAEYHALQQRRSPEWNQAKTAKALGVKDAEVSNRLAVARALKDEVPLVVQADKYSVALGVTQRLASRQRDSAAELMGQMLQAQQPEPEVEAAAPTLELDTGEIETLAESPFRAKLVPFRHADFTQWVPDYTGPRYNFLHCDFPYGVNAQSHAQGAGSAFGSYDDSADVYFQLLGVLAAAMENVVAESAHMMFWFSMDYYEVTRIKLQEMGWAVNPFPLIWHKSDNSGILPDPKRGPRRIYETAFICSRGDRLIVQPVANTFSAPNVKQIHMSEKNPDMLAHFFRMFVDDTTIMLDPTMGSGNAVVVAEKMGAAHVLGLERDPEFFARSSDAYIKALTPPQV